MFTLKLELDSDWPIEEAVPEAKRIADMLDVTVEFEIEKIVVQVDRYSDIDYSISQFHSEHYRRNYHPCHN